MTDTTTIHEPAGLFIDNQRWGDMRAWNRDAVALHGSCQLLRVEVPGFTPLWAVIDHAAVHDIERHPARFTNAPEPVLTNLAAVEARQVDVKTLIHLDDPEHNKLRKLTVDWFKPSTLGKLDGQLAALTAEALSKMEAAGGRCDFAQIALPYPLHVILRILGLPETDFPRMLTLTQQLFGQEDPDLQRGELSPEMGAAVLMDFYNYFNDLTESRRANPTDDLATLIANGTVDGEPLPPLQLLGYYLIIATAGHDTTSSAMAGGMQLLAENPDQLALLQAQPDLIPNAVEEIIRLTTPVRHFMRTAQEDTEICGQAIAKGDWLYLSYKAANLDPKVFPDPLRFDVTRANASKHLAFGFGVHYCLGALLARMELRSLFNGLIPRLASLELDGVPTTMKTTFVGGNKTLPIRYTLK